MTAPNDPLQELLAGATPPQNVDRSDGRRERILALRPDLANQLDGVDQVAILAQLIPQQTRLISEIVQLEGHADAGARSEQLRPYGISGLQQLLDSLRRPVDPAHMSREALLSELSKRLQQPEEAISLYPDEQLRQTLGMLLAKEATASHAINAPEAVAPQTDPNAAQVAQATAPSAEPSADKPKKSRGLKFPGTDQLVSNCSVKSGTMQAFLQAQGLPVPARSGKARRMKAMCTLSLTGEPINLGEFEPYEEGSADAPTPPPAIPTPPPTGPPSIPTAPPVAVPGLPGLPGLPDLGIPAAPVAGIPVSVPEPVSAPAVAVAPATPAPTIKGPSEQAELTAEELAYKQACVNECNELATKIGHPYAPLTTMEHPIEAITQLLTELRLKISVSSPWAEKKAFTLYVDCRPLRANVDNAMQLAAPLMQGVAQAAGADHYLTIPMGQGAKSLAALFYQTISKDPFRNDIYCSSASKTGALLIEAIAPLAGEIVESTR